MEINNNSINIQVRQQENDDFFAAGTDWWVGKGVFIMLLSLVAILSLAWFVHYPDLLSARAIVFSESPPVRVFVRQPGELEAIFVEDNQPVEKHTLLAVLKSAANWRDVLQLDSLLTTITATEEVQLPAVFFSNKFRLGDIQPAFSGFIQSWKAFANSYRSARVQQQNVAIDGQYESAAAIQVALTAQKKKMIQQIALMKEDSMRNQKLFAEGLVSKADCEKTDLALLQLQQAMDNHETNLRRNEQELDRLRDDLHKNLLEFEDDSYGLRLQYFDKLHQLDAQVQQWKLNYLVYAATEGLISMPRKWVPGQQVLPAEPFTTILPRHTSQPPFAVAFLPMKNAGKVTQGQLAEIRLESYPYLEFGSLRARVQYIAPVAEAESYKILLELDTSATPRFPLKQEMYGEAWITTSNRNVIERMLGKYLGMN